MELDGCEVIATALLENSQNLQRQPQLGLTQIERRDRIYAANCAPVSISRIWLNPFRILVFTVPSGTPV